MTDSILNDFVKHLENPDSDFITLVRRQVVYSEIVIPKAKYDEIRNDPSPYFDSYEELVSQMVTDDCMKSLGDDEDSWMAFSGDVTDCSDDLVSFTNKEWTDFWHLNYD